MAENRRIRITKMLIRDAFLEILKTTPFEKISVTQICKVAEINRATFYAHFEDTRQLLNEIENSVMEQIPVPADIPTIYTEDSFQKMLEEFFTYIQKNAEMFSLLMNTGNDRFSQRLIQNVFERYSAQALIAQSQIARYGYIFSINGVIGLTKEWMTSGFPLSPERFSRIVLVMSRGANLAAEEIEK